MRHWIETRFATILVLSCIAGLAVPAIGRLPNELAVWILAALMFLASYQLRDCSFSGLPWKRLALFQLLRYAALPLAAWGMATQLLPDYAAGIFLLTAMPAAVSSPAIAALYGGDAAVAFAVAIVSQLCTPFLLPLLLAALGSDAGAPEPLALFHTMLLCILLPLAVWAAVRRHEPSAAYFYRNGRLATVLLIGLVVALAVGKQREVILTHIPQLGQMVVMTLVCYAGYLAFGHLFARRLPKAQRLAFVTCSGFNNAALGVSLALLHFAPPVVLFVAVSEIGWSLLPVMMRAMVRRTA